ncbi:hypothetical protein L1887_30072 [Cichorium endivia]|nr:hypothetical protein L1887_30072 [Cichorium endivia]
MEDDRNFGAPISSSIISLVFIFCTDTPPTLIPSFQPKLGFILFKHGLRVFCSVEFPAAGGSRIESRDHRPAPHKRHQWCYK